MRPRVHPRATPVRGSLSHQSELTLLRERSAAGASQATQLAFVPLSADPVCAARAPFGGEPFSCLRSCRSAPPRLRTRLPGECVILLPALAQARVGGFTHLGARGAWRGRCPAWSRVRRPPSDGRRSSRNTLKHGK